MSTRATEPRRVLRSRSDRVVAGVAGGFGRYFGVDPVLIRLGLVLLTFAGGIGALVYLVAWLIVPEEAVTAEDPAGTRSRTVPLWLMAIILSALVLSGGIGRLGLGLRPDVFWPLGLILVGLAVLWLRAAPDEDHSSLRPTAPPVAVTAREPGTADVATPYELPASPAPSSPTPSPSPLRRAAPLVLRFGTAVFSAVTALVLMIAIVCVLEGRGDLEITVLEVVAVGVLMIAGALWAGRRWSRMPELVIVAAVSILVLGFAAWLRPPLAGGFGTRDVRPRNVASIDRSYELAAGRLNIDLGQVDLGSRPRTLNASLGVGLMEIVVPDDVRVVLDAQVRGGQLCAFGVDDGGTDINRRVATRGGSGVVNVHARLGLGRLLVSRPSDPAPRDCTHDPGVRPLGKMHAAGA